MTEKTHELSDLAGNEIMRTAVAVAGEAEIHLVGGAIRDFMLGVPSPDLDLVVSTNGRRISERLAESTGARLVLLGGDRFAAYRLARRDLVVDIWDRQGTSLLSDLQRRDFTINAVALDLRTEGLHDPFDGLGDLGDRRLRAVTETSFESDPLRVLRLVRFATLLPGFSVEPHTVHLARAAAPQIGEVATERIREELATILARAAPAQAASLMIEVDLLPRLWNRDRLADAEIEALARTLAAYELAEDGAGAICDAVPDRLLCVHALLARAVAHQSEPTGVAVSPHLTRTQTRSVVRLATNDRSRTSPEPRRFLASWGELWLEATLVAAALANETDGPLSDRLRALSELVAQEGPAVLDPRPLLDGSEIQKLLDLPPGPEIGRLLEVLLDAQLRGAVTDRDTARQFLEQARGGS